MTDPVATAYALLESFSSAGTDMLRNHYTTGATVHPSGHAEPVALAAWCASLDLIREAHPGLRLRPENVVAGDGLVIIEGRLIGQDMDLAGTVVLELTGALVSAERHYWRD